MVVCCLCIDFRLPSETEEILQRIGPFVISCAEPELQECMGQTRGALLRAHPAVSPQTPRRLR